MDRYHVTWTEELLPFHNSNTGHTLFRPDQSRMSSLIPRKIQLCSLCHVCAYKGPERTFLEGRVKCALLWRKLFMITSGFPETPVPIHILYVHQIKQGWTKWGNKTTLLVLTTSAISVGFCIPDACTVHLRNSLVVETQLFLFFWLPYDRLHSFEFCISNSYCETALYLGGFFASLRCRTPSRPETLPIAKQQVSQPSEQQRFYNVQ